MSNSIGTLVTGVATVLETDPVLDASVRMAATLSAELYLVHAYDTPELLDTHPEPAPGEAPEDVHTRYGRTIRAALKERVREATRYPRVHVHAVPGPAEEAVLRVAEETGAGLVVVGASHHGRMEQALLGTVAERVSRGARAPVLVLRTPFHPPKRVLLTTDLSALSAAAHAQGMEVAAALAGEKEPTFRSLLVMGHGVAPVPLAENALDETAEREMAEFLEAQPRRALPVEPKIRTGIAEREIVTEAEEWGADLLVMGTHGRTGFSRLFLGSVAEWVLRRAPCSVLVVPARSTVEGGTRSAGTA